MLRTFDQLAAAGRDVTVDCDVVVVGSGAGGGAIAAELAEGGRSVVVVEEGGHYTSKDFTLDAPTMIKKLYRNAGSAPILGRPNIIFSEGRCVGGSTVINGAMSWRTPEKVLKRWQWEHGLADLSPEALDPFFTKVEQRVSVGPQDPESIGEDARIMQRGADKLGYAWVPAMRSQKHCCGANNCAFGCPTDAKQSVLVTYVPRLLAAGGQLFSGCKVERVLTDGQRATGVVARMRHPESGARGPKLTVRAKVVVLACGAVQTPALLLRNGLTNSSDQVGRNFLCHPNSKVVGIFDHPIHAWKGTIQGNQIREFIDEGIMITTSMVPPGLLAMSFPYFGARSWEVMRDYDKMLAAGCLVEDTGSGRVGLDLFGEAKMRYDLNDRDFHNLIRGVALTAEILFASGARRVLLPFDFLPAIDSPDQIAKLFAHSIPKDEVECLTVHAMGTCRMGVDKRSSVVDPHGETWDVPGLFVADASVFPGPIGVNPQITIMALATRTGRWLLDNEQRYFA
ncbi:MAG: glucose-methanol-choline oxidoreductase [bacterium]|nr:glucose-methanol-choline oxidoreductase [bacterium]